MTFLAYELACNPEIQERLRDEINEVLDDFDYEICFDSMNEMKYLDMVFKETLRKWPVNHIQFRKSLTEYKIQNSELKIPKNTLIIIPTFGIHRDERFFENPEEFQPERFSIENVKKIDKFSFIPFGGGERECLGELSEDKKKCPRMKISN